jgi:methyltransferase of ATP-grasp peptide maturase system
VRSRQEVAVGHELRAALAEKLARRGAVRSPGWRAAFERVPRHIFVPRFEYREGQDHRVVDGAVAGQRDDWLAGVYRDEALVIRYDAVNPTTPASSSSMPTLMAGMLEALGVEEGERVLEIGTGTGYNAALLCERLGSERVTTIDIDPELVRVARERLAEAGYRPAVVAGDGWAGFATNAPYDRLIATGAVHSIPRAWIEQVRPGGVIVAPVSRGIARVVVERDGSAIGRFLRVPVGFMRMRGGPVPAMPSIAALVHLSDDAGAPRPVTVPADILEDDAFWFFARLAFVPFEVRFGTGDELDRITDLADGSWARLDTRAGLVVQGGPRRLWDQIEELYEFLDRNGRPERERFGLTVRPDGSQFVWLDSPEQHRWELV